MFSMFLGSLKYFGKSLYDYFLSLSLRICEVVLKNWTKPMTAPRTMPPTFPHGAVPNSRSANQPRIKVKTIEPKRMIAAE